MSDLMNSAPPDSSPTPDDQDSPHDGGGNGAGPDLVAVIGELQKQLEEAKNERLLALAEAENASRRADKRIADNAKYAVSNIAKALLQVADNLSRALLAAPADARVNETVKNLALGVELTEKELLNVLDQQGVRKINALNQAFDANLHNAIQEVENTTVPSGTIVQVLQDGYTIHERLLRPAMVIVSRGGPKREAAAPSQPNSGVNTTA
jgi:molecular chaperone GrpE